MQNAGLDEAEAGIKVAGKNISNLRYADDTTLMAESKEELKSLLIKVKEEGEKAGLKLNIQKTKIMASGPITLWQIDGEAMETVRLYFGGSKITADGDCSHEIKTLAPWNGIPWWLRGQSVCLQCRLPGFNPWVRKIPWRRKRQPTPVFLPGESHGWKSLMGYSPRGRKESDMIE